jgi:hypothetical protein
MRQMLDVTGMSDDEQDELFSLLFGHTCDFGDDRQGCVVLLSSSSAFLYIPPPRRSFPRVCFCAFAIKALTNCPVGFRLILCRNGDEISMLQLGESPSPLPKLGGNRLATPRGDRRSSGDPSLQRLLKLQENIRHRNRMNELQQRMVERKERQARIAQRRAAGKKAAVAAPSPRRPQQTPGSASTRAAVHRAAVHRDTKEAPLRTSQRFRDTPGSASARVLAGPTIHRESRKLPPLGPMIAAGNRRRITPAPPSGPPPARRISRHSEIALCADSPRASAASGCYERIRRSLDGDLSAFASDPDLEYGYDDAAATSLEARCVPTPRRPSHVAFPAGCDGMPGPRRVTLPSVKPGGNGRIKLASVDVSSKKRPASRDGVVKPRCLQCSRRLRITATYSCRCGGSYCGRCRHAEQHSCTFDYKTDGRRILAETTRTSLPSKLPKI